MNEMVIFNILIPIASVFIGSLITWYISKRYYVKSGKDLASETKELRKLLDCIIILQQDKNGQYMPKLDDDGKLITIVGLLSGTINCKKCDCESK